MLTVDILSLVKNCGVTPSVRAQAPVARLRIACRNRERQAHRAYELDCTCMRGRWRHPLMSNVRPRAAPHTSAKIHV
jgi:hypothetical protein